MGAQRLSAIVHEVGKAQKQFLKAAGGARVIGDHGSAGHFDQMAAYLTWRLEQLDLLRQGQRDQMPTFAEWRRLGWKSVQQAALF